MTATPQVDTLTATIHTITIDSRRVTLTMYKQLDLRRFDAITVYGRVRTGIKHADQWGFKEAHDIELIGADDSGELVRSFVRSRHLPPPRYQPDRDADAETIRYAREKWDILMDRLDHLPLIVLGR